MSVFKSIVLSVSLLHILEEILWKCVFRKLETLDLEKDHRLTEQNTFVHSDRLRVQATDTVLNTDSNLRYLKRSREIRNLWLKKKVHKRIINKQLDSV